MHNITKFLLFGFRNHDGELAGPDLAKTIDRRTGKVVDLRLRNAYVGASPRGNTGDQTQELLWQGFARYVVKGSRSVTT